jgi:anthranilate synthase component 2/para-aminobenzoate synthetase component 2
MKVFRNDKITVDEIEALKPKHIVISPGPCTPREGGVSNDIIRISAEAPGAGRVPGASVHRVCQRRRVVRAERLMHGKTDQIHHDGKTIYAGMPNPFTATRYHSLIIKQGTLPKEFEISSWTDHDEIMGIRHKTWPLEGCNITLRAFSPSTERSCWRTF